MGVYINMEMPKNCDECRIMVFEDTNCAPELFCGCPIVFKAHSQGVGHRPDYCPLVPVPPHGRLIDADALMHEFEKAQRTMAKHGQEYSCSFMSSSQELSTEWYCVEDMLENAPTVIEAEEGET